MSAIDPALQSNSVPFVDYGDNMRLRDMCRQMLLSALAPHGKQLSGSIADLKRAMDWDRPRNWSTRAVTGVLRPANREEIDRIKSCYNSAFSHLKFFVGEIACENPASDIAALADKLLSGEMALATAYKHIQKMRKTCLYT